MSWYDGIDRTLTENVYCSSHRRRRRDSTRPTHEWRQNDVVFWGLPHVKATLHEPIRPTVASARHDGPSGRPVSDTRQALLTAISDGWRVSLTGRFDGRHEGPYNAGADPTARQIGPTRRPVGSARVARPLVSVLIWLTHVRS